MVRNLLKELKIICISCNQSFNYEDISKHDEECVYRPKKCPGCSESIITKEYEEYISNCDEIKIRYKKCDFESTRKKYNDCCNTIKFMFAKLRN